MWIGNINEKIDGDVTSEEVCDSGKYGNRRGKSSSVEIGYKEERRWKKRHCSDICFTQDKCMEHKNTKK